jgi:hypothetical protein
MKNTASALNFHNVSLALSSVSFPPPPPVNKNRLLLKKAIFNQYFRQNSQYFQAIKPRTKTMFLLDAGRSDLIQSA